MLRGRAGLTQISDLKQDNFYQRHTGKLFLGGKSRPFWQMVKRQSADFLRAWHHFPALTSQNSSLAARLWDDVSVPCMESRAHWSSSLVGFDWRAPMSFTRLLTHSYGADFPFSPCARAKHWVSPQRLVHSKEQNSWGCELCPPGLLVIAGDLFRPQSTLLPCIKMWRN